MTNRESCQKRRDRLRAEGRCIWCGLKKGDDARAGLCGPCYALNYDRRVGDVRSHPLRGTYRCSKCGERGHNAKTCGAPPLPDVTRERLLDHLYGLDRRRPLSGSFPV